MRGDTISSQGSQRETAGRPADAELGARLLRRRYLHEAAHAVVGWLAGAEVVAVGQTYAYVRHPLPIVSAIVDVAGPASDKRSLAGLTPADMARPVAVKDAGEIRRAAALGVGMTDDLSRAAAKIAGLSEDPREQGRLYRGAWWIAEDMISDAWVVVEEVASALLSAGTLTSADFHTVVGRWPALRTTWALGSPWIDLAGRAAPSASSARHLARSDPH